MFRSFIRALRVRICWIGDLTTETLVSLHVGAHKTATTHLQRTLQRNAEVLQQNGVTFLGPKYLRDEDHRLADMFGLEGREVSVKGGEQVKLLADGAPRLLLSEENLLGLSMSDQRPGILYPRAAVRVGRLLEHIPPMSATLFISVRDPGAWLASLYSQKIKGGKIQTFEEFCTGFHPKDIAWSHLLRRLAALPNHRGITVWRYEDYKPVFPKAVQALTGADMAGDLKPIKRRLNTSLSGAAITQMLDWHQSKRAGHPERWSKEAAALFPLSDRFPAFDPWDGITKDESRRAYDADWQVIQKVPGVTVLGA